MNNVQKEKIQQFIDKWDELRTAYFWLPPKDKVGRRYMEEKNSIALSIKHNNNYYSGTIETRCTCTHIYVSKVLFVNGKKKRITELKKLLPKKIYLPKRLKTKIESLKNDNSIICDKYERDTLKKYHEKFPIKVGKYLLFWIYPDCNTNSKNILYKCSISN